MPIWEQGSEFHTFPDPDTGCGDDAAPWNQNGVYYSTGRAALWAILQFGAQHLNWKRIWAPSYYCPDVFDSIRHAGLTVVSYAQHPEQADQIADINAQTGDVVLLVNLFGLAAQPQTEHVYAAASAVIEDHTHDPWSPWAYAGTADWCFASLRKTLPLPDGAVVWSSKNSVDGLPITDQPNSVQEASLRKLAGMVLKGHYLAGLPVEKPVFRKLLVEAEAALHEDEPTCITPWSREILRSLPWTKWRRQRRQNYWHLVELLQQSQCCEVILPQQADRVVPFSTIVAFQSQAERSWVRQYLTEHSVYPSVLWDLSDLEGATTKNRTFSTRMLSFHNDMRYSVADMDRLAALIQEAVWSYRAASEVA